MSVSLGVVISLVLAIGAERLPDDNTNNLLQRCRAKEVFFSGASIFAISDLPQVWKHAWAVLPNDPRLTGLVGSAPTRKSTLHWPDFCGRAGVRRGCAGMPKGTPQLRIADVSRGC